MRLRRRKVEVPEPSKTEVRIALDSALLLRDTLDHYERLLSEFESSGTNADLRTAALIVARRISAYERLTFITASELEVQDPGYYSPVTGLAVLQVLAYALVALSEEEPDPSTLLSTDEVDALLDQRDARAWLDRVLSLVHGDWEAM
jgi:hypothetical protein